jgi:hypothetical protein
MLELIIPFEFVQQALISRLPGDFVSLDRKFFGLAGLFFFLYLFPMIIAPPVALAEVPVEAVLVGGLILAGFVLCATIVLAPIGFILF